MIVLDTHVIAESLVLNTGAGPQPIDNRYS
jgi:hypothetical protein